VLSAGIPGIVAAYFASNLGATVYSAENDRILSLARLLNGDTATVLHDSRVALVSGYVDLISRHPIFGYGTGLIMSRAVGPHNMFLALWVENGVFGPLGYLMLLVGCFWHFRKTRDSRGQALCLALFVFSFFSHNLLNSSSRPIFVTLGLLSGIAVSVAGSKSAHSGATGRATARPLLARTRGNSVHALRTAYPQALDDHVHESRATP
jgi:O-antigen ligase